MKRKNTERRSRRERESERERERERGGGKRERERERQRERERERDRGGGEAIDRSCILMHVHEELEIEIICIKRQYISRKIYKEVRMIK